MPKRKTRLKKHYSKFKILGVLFIIQTLFLIFNEVGLKSDWLEAEYLVDERLEVPI